jgi:hypothetical protein
MRDLKLVCYTGLALLLVSWAAMAQTVADPQVWSCLTNCSATSNTYNDGAWRLASTRPAFVAATTGTNTDCSRKWWNTTGAVRWRRLVDVGSDHCVAARRTTAEDVFLRASSLWPSAPPVNCVVSEWSEWVAGEWSQCVSGQQTRTETRTRTVLTPASNGGTCPALSETMTVSQICTAPAPSVQISLSSHRVYTNDPVIVTWSSTNADSCSASWAESIPFSGSQSLTMTVPNTEHWVYVACTNPYGNYRADVGFRVVSRAPDCYPDQDRPGDSDKVEVKAISVANMTLRYQVFATWFCATPDGPKQQKWAIGMEDGFREARNWLNKRFNKAAAIARCESECEPLPDGALRTELDEWAAQFTSEQLGVIDP